MPMRALALLLASPLAALPSPAASSPSPQTPSAQQPGERSFALHCGTLHTGDGSVVRDAIVLVDDGVIQAVVAADAAGAVPPGTRLIDASDKVVMPGIVAADTDLSGQPDDDYAVTPDLVAADGFDFLRSRTPLLSGGVTTVYLSPGRARLISGQGSVVKTSGDLLSERILAESACLRINMGDAATRAPAVFEPTTSPTSDDPLLPAREQFPSARISLLSELTRLFRDAAALEAEGATNGDLFGDGLVENRYSIHALQRATRGELPLRIAAEHAADLRRALYFAESTGCRVVLEDPWELSTVAAEAAQKAAGAVVRLPVMPGARNPGGENRDPAAAERRLDTAARAVAAGMSIALAPANDRGLRDFLMHAAIAIRHGLAADAAMRAITRDAAQILGVGDRVGLIAPGMHADLLVLSGEPFAIGTMVEQTFVTGDRVWQRESEDDLLAVRCDKIMTMAGSPLDRGVLTAANGRIKAVGEDLAVPFGARIIDIPGGVMVPGFIDAFSHLGLSGNGSGIPTGNADQRVADVISADDPLLAQAARAGLTTVLVAGRDANTVSGRVAAVKTAGETRDERVLREIAALRFVHDSVDGNGIKPLADAVQRGRPYLEAWQKYEKELAAFNSGDADKEKEGEEPTPSPTDEPAAPDPLSGVWQLSFDQPPPVPVEIRFELELQGTTVKGSMVMSLQGREMPPAELQNGRFENGTLTGTIAVPMLGEGEVQATVTTDKMTGTISGQGQTIGFSATRVEKMERGSTGRGVRMRRGEDGAPKKPEINEALEPLRALLEGRIPAVVQSRKAPAIRAVVDWFAEQKLPLVLTGVDDAIDDPSLLGEAKPGVVLGPDVVRTERGKVTNAAAVLADHDLPLALGTGDTAGSRFLPLHAALAVRYGLDPTTALRTLTADAAKMFQLDDRIGSLERGKDADFVVFSGSPFEMTSRVLLVVVGGRVVHDGREANR